MGAHKEYQGHRNRNAWNVALYLFNEYSLYRTMVNAVNNSRSKDEAAEYIAGLLAGQSTPDGVPYTRTNIRLALQHWDG
jgi:hypothetical protein